MEETIANLTHHQNITDAMLTSMGECMALQQALLHVPAFNGKNMPLKTFIQDVENGYTFVPEGLRDSFFKGVISKLKETARDAVNDKTINSIEDLSNILKEHFSPKKSYPHYCAEIQAVRLRRDETVLDYYTRIKQLRTSAIAALKDKFTDAQTTQMQPMLDGLALESFKRGLSDDLIYAVSVQDPQNLEDAFKIVQRIERDMQGASARNSNSLHYTQSEQTRRDSTSPRRVSFQSPDRKNDPNAPRENNNFGRFSRRDNVPPRENNFGNFFRRDNTPPRENRNNSNQYSRNSTRRNFYPPYPPQGFYPPMHYMPMMFPPYPQYQAEGYFQQPMYQNGYNNQQSFSQNKETTMRSTSPRPTNSEHLNSQEARRADASTSDYQNSRPATVKYLTVANILDGRKDADSPQ